MKLINKIQNINGTRFEKILKATLLVFVSVYFFWLPSFSEIFPFNIVTYFILALIAVICLILLISSKSIYFCKNVFIVLLVYLIVSLFSTLLHINVLGLKGLREWLRLLLLFLSFIIIYNSFKIIGDKNKIIFALLLSLLVFSGYFFAYYINDIISFLKGSDKRLGGDFINVNALSSFFALGYIISLYLIFYLRKKIRFLFTLLCFIFIFLGLTTGSRQFLLSLFIATYVFLFWFFRKKKVFLIITILSLIFVVVLIFTVPQLSFIKNKFMFLFDITGTKDLSAIQRLLMQINAIFDGGKSFVFGHGQLSFSFYTAFDGYSHNAYTNAFFETGIIGLLCLVLLLILIFKNSYRLKDEYFSIVLLIVIYYIVVGFFSVWFREKQFYVSLSFVCFLTSCEAFKNNYYNKLKDDGSVIII